MYNRVFGGSARTAFALEELVGPSYTEMGLGVGSIASSEWGILVAFAERKEVRVLAR